MARQSTRLEVVADGEKWSVREHGIGRLSSHATKVAATTAARAVATLNTPSELIIRKADGSIESEQSFQRPQPSREV
jgi:hypothetical protein